MPRTRTLVLSLLVGTLPAVARAQCPDGSPPRADGTCVPQRRPASVGAAAPSPVSRRIPTPGWQVTAGGDVGETGGRVAITADGTMIAYGALADTTTARFGEPRTSYLLTQHLAAGARPLRLVTLPHPLIGAVQAISWLPDGRSLAINGVRGVFAVPATGGAPQRLAAFRGLLSPTGEHVARASAEDIMIVSVRSGDTVRLRPAPGRIGGLRRFVWSPDGASILAATFDDERRGAIYLQLLRNGATRLLLADSVVVMPIAWSRAAGALYYTRQIGRTTRQVWKLPLSPSGIPLGRPVLVVPTIDAVAGDMSISDSGSLVVARSWGAMDNIRMVGTGEDTASRWLTRGMGVRYAPRFAPDSRRVAFALDEGATTSLWVTRTDSGGAEQFAFADPGIIEDLAWSPDGTRIAVCRWGEAAPRIDVVTVATGAVDRLPARAVPRDCSVGWASGHEVMYRRLDGRNYIVQSLRGGATRTLLPHDSVGYAFSPHVDPTGRFLAVTWNRPAARGQHVWLVSLADSSERILLRSGFGAGWSTTGDAYYAVRFTPRGIVRIAIAGDSMSLLRGCEIGGGSISPEGSQTVCNEGAEWRPELWLFEHFDPTWPRRRATPRR